jgi:hypothetical protein
VVGQAHHMDTPCRVFLGLSSKCVASTQLTGAGCYGGSGKWRLAAELAAAKVALCLLAQPG